MTDLLVCRLLLFRASTDGARTRPPAMPQSHAVRAFCVRPSASSASSLCVLRHLPSPLRLILRAVHKQKTTRRSLHSSVPPVVVIQLQSHVFLAWGKLLPGCGRLGHFN